MYSINRPVVQHTWSLFKRSRDRHPEKVYGDKFVYSEILAKSQYHQAVLYVFALYVFLAGILFPPVSLSPVAGTCVLALTSLQTRWILKRVLPQPGTGPSPYVLPHFLRSDWIDHITRSRKGFFEITNISNSGSSKIKTVIKADGEPGYFGTARIISEAALALALNFDKLPYKQVGGAGVLTPMAALGDVHIERMKKYYGLQVKSEVVSGDEGRKRR